MGPIVEFKIPVEFVAKVLGGLKDLVKDGA
jgi:hypothetical protein